jgi:hypothetical protein
MLVLTVLALPATAQQTITPPADIAPSPPPPSVPMQVMASPQVCAALAASNGSADVSTPPGVPGADYQPGVDANGDAVAPADLPSSNPPGSSGSPGVDNMPILIDKRFVKAFNLPPGIGAKALLGYVTLNGNQPYFNGLPLNADQSAALSDACRNAKH